MVGVVLVFILLAATVFDENNNIKDYLPEYGALWSRWWGWDDFGSYAAVCVAFAALVGAFTWIFQPFYFYVEALGFAALLLEAGLGLPQLTANWSRRSTQGMSISMVGAWFIGDVGKTLYFLLRHTPMQFWICGSLQILIDVMIFLQVWWYWGKHPIPRKVTAVSPPPPRKITPQIHL